MRDKEVLHKGDEELGRPKSAGYVDLGCANIWTIYDKPTILQKCNHSRNDVYLAGVQATGILSVVILVTISITTTALNIQT